MTTASSTDSPIPWQLPLNPSNLVRRQRTKPINCWKLSATSVIALSAGVSFTVLHPVEATKKRSSTKQIYFAQRSFELYPLKNLLSSVFVRHRSVRLVADLLLLGVYLGRRKDRAFGRAKTDAIGLMPLMPEKGRQIHRCRQVPDNYLDPILTNVWFAAKITGRLLVVNESLKV